MTVISNPRTTVNINSAAVAIVNQPQKILCVGPQTATATATDFALNVNVQKGAESALHGSDSILANMMRFARKINGVNQFDSIGVDDDGSGVAATGTIVVTGTATATGSIDVTAGSRSDYKVSVAIVSGDTATEVGDSIVTAVTAITNKILSASNTTGTVTFTALNKGTIGNSIPLEVEGSVAGIVTAVTTMASGATDPTLTTVFDNVGDSRYQAILWGFPADTSELITFLDARFNVTNDVLNGVGFTADVDSLANLESANTSLNSQSLTVFGFKKQTETDYAGPAVVEVPVMIASYFAGIRSLRFTDGEAIAQFVTTSQGALDSFGGPALASKPYFNTPFPDLFVEITGRGWTLAEIASLKIAGVSVIGNNRPATELITGEVVTTYKTDSGGNPDISFKFLNFVDTASGVREFFVNNLNSTFAQSRLTTGDLVAGRSQANEALIRATLIGFYSTLAGSEFVLTQSGEAALQTFINNLTVVIDLAVGSATITMKVPLVVQVR